MHAHGEGLVIRVLDLAILWIPAWLLVLIETVAHSLGMTGLRGVLLIPLQYARVRVHILRRLERARCLDLRPVVLPISPQVLVFVLNAKLAIRNHLRCHVVQLRVRWLRRDLEHATDCPGAPRGLILNQV